MPQSKLSDYRLTPAAQDDLEAIWLYGYQTWSIEQANHYIDTLEKTFKNLLFMPEIAREYTAFNPPVRIHPSAEHIIAYHVQNDYLVILRILGGKQDWHAILKAIDQ